jgi:hypothetical protein
LKCPEIQRWREEIMISRWSHINKEIALRKILTVKNAIEQRNVGTLSCSIKFKWQNQVKKAELRLEEERFENICRIECCKQHG